MQALPLSTCIFCAKKYQPTEKDTFLLCAGCLANQRLILTNKEDRAEYIPPDEIDKGLWLGSYASANNEVGLKALNIKNILIVGDNMHPRFPDQFVYKQIQIADEEESDIFSHLPELVRFIEDCVKRDESILVHCMGGVSRSASVVTAYVMKKYGWGFEKAVAYVRGKRSCVYPNTGFVKQLKEYEKVIGL